MSTLHLDEPSTSGRRGARAAAALPALRRRLHQIAEPGWCEFQTSALIVGALEQAGLQVAYGEAVIRADARLGVPPMDELDLWLDRARGAGVEPRLLEAMRGGMTGAVAVIRGDRPGPVTALRFDIDANLGQEDCDHGHAPARLGFSAEHPEAHHNCGHDGHAALGIAVGRALAERRAEVRGEVRLIFQPAEEGLRGAHAMVAAGVLKDVTFLLGCHVGVQARRTGVIVAGYRNLLGSRKFDARFRGCASHAALSPHQGRNALLAACAAVQGLHGIVQHGEGETRVNVGRLQAGVARNTVPGEALICAELRGQTEPITRHLVQRATSVLRGAAAMFDVELELDWVGDSPPANSSPDMTALVVRAAADPGVSEVVEWADFRACDDMAVMMQAVQRQGGVAGYFGLGSALSAAHHNPSFDFDDACLELGLRIFLRALAETGNLAA